MAANILQEFLVGISYSVDKQSETDFVDGLKKAALAVGAFALGAVASLEHVAKGLEDLYFASKRTGASVENIKALGFAVGQMGGTAAGAQASLEALASFMRSSPGANNWLNALGVQTKDAHGHALDTADVTQGLGKRLSAMPWYQAKAYAGVAGIDERTLMALREGVGEFSREYQEMYKVSGIDAQKAAADSHVFMNSLRGVGAAVGILSDKVAADLTKGAGDNLNRFREGLVRNFGRIEHGMEAAAKVALAVATAVVTLATRAAQAFGDLSDWFANLDSGTKHVIEGLGLLLIAWRLLNAGFLATPLGRVLALGAALLALYDDYKTWQEGGKSLIDWSVWEPQIEQAKKAFKEFGDAIKQPLADFAKAFKDDVVSAWHWLDDNHPNFGQDSLKEFIHLLQLATDILKGDFKKAREDAALVLADERKAYAAQEKVEHPEGDNPDGKGRGLIGLYQRYAPEWAGGTGDGKFAPGEPKANDASLDKNREQAVTWWQRVAGFTPQGAAGMAAQEEQESGYQPWKRGDNNQAGGSFQWHQDRRDKILNAVGIDVWKDMDPNHQRLAALAEMKMGLDAAAGNAYERIMGARDSGEAAKLGVTLVERPKDTLGEIRNRGAIAARIEQHMAQVSGPAAARTPPPGVPNIPMPAGQMLRAENNRLPAPVLNQTTNVTVNGVSDPKQAARSVEDAQTRVNGNMVRNFLPAAY
jgi:hypothetical protein